MHENGRDPIIIRSHGNFITITMPRALLIFKNGKIIEGLTFRNIYNCLNNCYNKILIE